MTTDLILGTAGHIDHGKTSLIRALTGTNTDRLPEEKRRGITIELGFAELTVDDYRFGIVDVPGHERFIRNMLCGATGMDLVMLVIAADDSVKQQTREHLDILRLLDLSDGVIVLTKVDLVDRGWADLVEAEIRDLVASTFLEGASIVRTSATTGLGLDTLRRELVAAAGHVVQRRHRNSDSGPFCMAIDRTFTIAGHGTVVTGSVARGVCRTGDELRVEPRGVTVRVRGIQSHDRSVDLARRGQRAAINLVGVHHTEIEWGQQLCSPGHLKPSKLLTVSLTLLESAPRPLKDRARMKLHMGTAELVAAVRLLDQEWLQPGETGFAQLFLSEPTVSVWNQPFVIRFESPAATAGGGRVLSPNAERIRKRPRSNARGSRADTAHDSPSAKGTSEPRVQAADPEIRDMVERLAGSEVVDRASAALYFNGLHDWQPADLARTAGIDSFQEVTEKLVQRGDLRLIAVSPTRTIRLHRLVLGKLYDRIAAALKKLHEKFPLRTEMDRATLASGFAYLGEDSILTAALKDMHAAGRIRFGEHGISLVGHGPKLSANEQKVLTQLIDLFRGAGMQPPSVKECQQQAQKHQSAVPQLLALAAANGELVEVGPDFFLHSEVERQARDLLRNKLRGSSGLTLSEIREILNTTRKYAVPYCEYLDRTGFTVRRGDVRVLAGN